MVPGNPPLTRLGNPASRADLVVNAITRAILTGDLPPGSRLVERDVASLLGVSKTPVREALKVLERKGLTTVNAFRGAEVRIVDETLARDVYGVRVLLEPAAVRQSIGLYDSGGLELARGALEAADDAATSGDLAELCLANRRFHQLLYEPCPNQLLRKTLDDLQDQVALISVGGWRRRSTWEDESREHRSILAAVEDENGEQAEDEVRSHIAKFFAGQLLAPELATVPLAAEL